MESYSDLNRIMSLEDQCELYFDKKFHDYVVIWQYGFHYLTLLLDHNLKPDRTYMPFVAYFTEAHSALRASFTINMHGYNSDAIAILRKAFESLLKAAVSKANPFNFENIWRSKNTNKLERALDIKLESIHKITSSFMHSNNHKVATAVIQYYSDKEEKAPVTYGPQTDDFWFGYAACLSIFLMYISVKFLPKIFPKQIDEIWLSKNDECARLMKYYLDSRKSGFAEDCKQIDNCLDRIDKQT